MNQAQERTGWFTPPLFYAILGIACLLLGALTIQGPIFSTLSILLPYGSLYFSLGIWFLYAGLAYCGVALGAFFGRLGWMSKNEIIQEEMPQRIEELAIPVVAGYERRNLAQEVEAEPKDLEAEPIPKPVELIERRHSWDPDLITQFGKSRCRVCGMQYEYYDRGRIGLEHWPENEKSNKDYALIFNHYQCKESRIGLISVHQSLGSSFPDETALQTVVF